jgi:cell division protein FtsB
MNKLYALILIGLVAVLTLVLVYSQQGLFKLSSLEGELGRVESENAAIKEENRRLMHEIERARTDPGFLEDVARQKLGLIRTDETIYRLREEPDSSFPPPNG